MFGVLLFGSKVTCSTIAYIPTLTFLATTELGGWKRMKAATAIRRRAGFMESSQAQNHYNSENASVSGVVQSCWSWCRTFHLSNLSSASKICCGVICCLAIFRFNKGAGRLPHFDVLPRARRNHM